MIVNSISLNNFKSYYGFNQFDFTDGLNIISGHEGSGKSNLFDAFMWVLFKRISGMNKYEQFDETNVSYINDRIKNKVFQEGSSKEDIICEVRIKVTVPKSIRRNTDRNYEIVRRKEIYLTKGKTAKNFHEENIWSCTNSELIVTWQDENYNTKELVDREAEAILEDIFPEKIRKYIWFQGEQLNELLDFDNETTLKKAVDYISHISSYEYMGDLINEIHRQLGVRAKNLIQANNRDKNKFSRLSADIDFIEKEIDRNKELITKKEKELIALNEDEKLQNDKLSTLASFPELKEKEGALIGKLELYREKVSHLNDQEKYLFKSKWMLKGTEFLFDQANEKIAEFTEHRRQLITKNDEQLEEGVPGDNLINLMLKKQHCIICDRPAKKGSKEYSTIKSHLDKHKNLNPLDPEIEDLNDKIIDIKSIPSKMKFKIDGISTEITNHQARIQEELNNRNSTNEELENIREKIRDLIREKGEAILNINPKIINSTLQRIKDDQERLRKQINKYKEDNIVNQFKYKSKLDEIKGLKNPDQGDLIEEKLTDYTEFIKEVIVKQTESERLKLVKKIKNTANSIQKDIANINNITIVQVEIDPDDYSLRFIDADGNPNPGHGAQNTLAKMSIISAIVKLSNEQKGENYPFIADAPTSDFASEFTNRFLESISNTYRQSIIISKDLINQIDEYKKKAFVNKIINISKECNDEIALSTNSYTVIK